MMLKEPVIRYLENQKDPKYVDSSWNIDVLFTRQQSKSEMLNGNDLKCCNLHHLQEDNTENLSIQKALIGLKMGKNNGLKIFVQLRVTLSAG